MCEDYRRAQMIARCRYVAVTSLRPLEGPRKIRSQHVIEAALFTACGDPTRRMGRAVHTDWVSPAREIEGRDHLAMQAVSGRLYNGLRPGLTKCDPPGSLLFVYHACFCQPLWNPKR